jgi:hypothetical protein
MPPSRNYWTTYKRPFAGWQAVIPATAEPEDTERLLQFCKQVLIAGEQEKVYRLVRESHDTNDSPNLIDLYIEYLRQRHTDPRFFNFGYIHEFEAFCGFGVKQTTLVCHYDLENKLASSEISNVVELLSRVRPDLDANLFAPEWKPLDIWGYKHVPSASSTFFIELQSNIWFPRVEGYDEDWFEDGEIKLYDNYAIALCHTPRLNMFLAEVRQAALEMGGSFGISGLYDGGAYNMNPLYIQVVNENGINLDQETDGGHGAGI